MSKKKKKKKKNLRLAAIKDWQAYFTVKRAACASPTLRQRLATACTGNNSVCHYLHHFFSLFTFFNNNQHQIFILFSLFISHQ